MQRRTARLAFALALLSLAAASRAQSVLRDNDIVAICGDSITEQKDYSVNVATYLLACQPAKNVTAVGAGWSGDSMGWFWGRNFDRDILSFHPTVVTTCYGMNDGGYRAVEPATLKNYRDGMTRLVASLKAGGVREIVIGSPGAVDTDTFRNDPKVAAVYNNTLAALGAEGRTLAEAGHLHFADVHTPMLAAMSAAKAKFGPKYHVGGGDGVHPSRNGHLVMAYAFLKGLGLDGDIGTLTLDLAAKTSTATAGHTAGAFDGTTATFTSTRYPFCFYGAPDAPDSTRSIVALTPFNQDLNRLMLVVKGAKSDKLKVTWGASSKTFPAAELATGVNLAAAFADSDTPFSKPFDAVRNAVRAQQEFETNLIKGYRANVLNQEKALVEADPTIAPAIAQVNAALITRRTKLIDAAAKAVVPVTHTIKIEPAE